jgi:hypothetical protein
MNSIGCLKDFLCINHEWIQCNWAEPVSLTFHSVLKKLYTEPSIGASYQISVHLATRFQRRRFVRNQPIRNKCLCNRIRYKFFKLKHLLLYINNIQIQLNIDTLKIQSFFIIRKKQKKTTTWNIRVQHNLIFANFFSS